MTKYEMMSLIDKAGLFNMFTSDARSFLFDQEYENFVKFAHLILLHFHTEGSKHETE